ncbi:conserved hypothetical protein [Parafrankia sp. Ea1.12]|nr:conserved hypothetical protein [Parafrankia sp. Ea1.12]
MAPPAAGRPGVVPENALDRHFAGGGTIDPALCAERADRHRYRARGSPPDTRLGRGSRIESRIQNRLLRNWELGRVDHACRLAGTHCAGMVAEA